MRGASHQPVFMDDCLAIVTCVLACLSVNGSVFVYLVLLKWMLHEYEPSLVLGVCYCQKCMLIWVMVIGSGNSVFVKP